MCFIRISCWSEFAFILGKSNLMDAISFVLGEKTLNLRVRNLKVHTYWVHVAGPLFGWFLRFPSLHALENFLWLFFLHTIASNTCAAWSQHVCTVVHMPSTFQPHTSMCLLYVGSNPWCSHWSACGLPSKGDCSVWRGGWIWDIVPANVSYYLYWWLFLSNGIDNVVLTLLQNYWCWKWVQDK